MDSFIAASNGLFLLLLLQWIDLVIAAAMG
jgi:hypothetical protein